MGGVSGHIVGPGALPPGGGGAPPDWVRGFSDSSVGSSLAKPLKRIGINEGG